LTTAGGREGPSREIRSPSERGSGTIHMVRRCVRGEGYVERLAKALGEWALTTVMDVPRYLEFNQCCEPIASITLGEFCDFVSGGDQWQSS